MYDLTVADEHVFFAGGVLVHNCDDCDGLDGETVALDDTFSDGEDGPPDHPSCRCTLTLETIQPGESSRRLVETERGAALWEQWDARLRPHENAAAASMRSYLREQSSAVQDAVAAGGQWWDDRRWQRRLRTVAQDFLKAPAQAFWQHALDDLLGGHSSAPVLPPA